MLEGGGIPTYETSPGSLIQCHLYPVIPWRVAPQHSLAPFHRMMDITNFDKFYPSQIKLIQRLFLHSVF